MPVVTIFREVGYEGALTTAKEIAEDLDVDIGLNFSIEKLNFSASF